MKHKTFRFVNNVGGSEEEREFRVLLPDHPFNRPHPPHAPIPPHPPEAPQMSGFVFSTGGSPRAQYQSIEDDILEVLVILPGLNKETLKVRSKPTKLSITAKMQDHYIGKLGVEKVNLMIDLIEEVQPEESNASYREGILQITFPLQDPGKDVDVDMKDN